MDPWIDQRMMRVYEENSDILDLSHDRQGAARRKELPSIMDSLFPIVRQFHMANHALTAPPPDLGQFKKLQVINLAGNEITHFPVIEAPVQSLDLTGNRLQDIKSILEIASLQVRASFNTSATVP